MYLVAGHEEKYRGGDVHPASVASSFGGQGVHLPPFGYGMV